jgi:hypothetical protein
MPIYTDAERLYTCLRRLFARIEAQEPQASEAMLKSGLRIRICCREPTAEFLFDARQRPLRIEYGPSNLRPDLDVSLQADTLHRILLGKLTLTKALGGKLIEPKGPVWKTTVLADLFYHAQRLYPQVLQEQGLDV